MKKLTLADFKVPAALLAWSVAPIIGVVVRLTSVARDVTVTPDNARFLRAPTPVLIHVVGATLFCLLGAFQFSTGFRLRFSGLHRRAGRVLAVSGLLTGATGVWMTLSYDIPRDLQGPLLYGVRLMVGTAMVVSVVLAWSAILRRDVPRHEAWMIRAYALGQGAGTQALVLGPWMVISGQSGGLTRDLLMTLSWAINVAVAELIVARRKSASYAHRRGGTVAATPR